MGFSQKELIHANAFTRMPTASAQPPLPAAFPSPRRCLHEVTPLSRRFRCYSAVRPLAGLRFPLRSSLIGSLILLPLRNPTSPPGVTHRSSAACRPHTPWYDGWMSIAFASIVQARPCPTFGRPVRLRDSSLDYGPAVLLMPFGFHLAVDTLPSGVPLVRRPARHYPRFWIWRPSSERQRDSNPPDLCAARRTLWPRLTPAASA